MTEQHRDGVAEAIAAARAGNLGAAYQLLRNITDVDPNNAAAWLWLGGVTRDPREQRAALERVLALDPSNTRARRGLQALRDRQPELFSVPEPPAPAESPAAPAVASAADASVDAAAPLSGATEPMPVLEPPADAVQPADLASTEVMPAVTAGATTAPEPETAAASTTESEIPESIRSSLDEELRCPHCGALTALEDTRCPHCQGELIVAADRTRGARLARVLLAALWLVGVVAAVAGSAWVLDESQRVQSGTDHTLGPLLQQLGLATRPAATLQVVSSAGLSLGGLALIGLILAVGLLLRWRAAYIINLLLLLAGLVGSIALLVAGLPVLTGTLFSNGAQGSLVLGSVAGAIVLIVVALVLTLASRREFFPRRVRARIPLQALSGAEHFKLGTRYRDRGWRWAAARELELAADQEPQVLKYRRALADVYASMGDHLRARDELRASFNLHPDTSPSARAGSMAEEVQRERQ